MKGGLHLDHYDSKNEIFRFVSIVNTRSPTSILTLQTIAFEAFTNLKANRTISITIMNNPLPQTSYELQVNNSVSGFFGALIFSLSLAFKFSSIASFIVK